MNKKIIVIALYCFSLINSMDTPSYGYSVRANGKGWKFANEEINWRNEDKVFANQ
jgi:hypothetical protein